ncbi:hypothetical protein PC121_g8988 [Phytophthora cactorum]|nr:hypothetical protein PC121_g8988 [Phytophthora cactorum]
MTLVQGALRRAAMARSAGMNDSRATTDMVAGGASPLLTKMWPARWQACLQADGQGTRSFTFSFFYYALVLFHSSGEVLTIPGLGETATSWWRSSILHQWNVESEGSATGGVLRASAVPVHGEKLSGVRSDYGQEEWPHVYADSMMFDMSKEEGEELAPGMATVVFEDALPEEAELDSGDPAELELGYEETGGPATSAFIGTAEGRETLLTLLTGMMSVPGPGETRAFRSWSDTPERAAPRV